MKTEAIIFDLFGTLIYSKIKLNPYANFFKSLNLDRVDITYWREKVMTSNFESFTQLKNEIRPDLPIWVDKYDWDVKREIENTLLFDDTYQVLENLSKKYKIYLISNLSTPYKECFYKLGLDRWIKEPIFSCDVGLKKPDPEIYKIAIKKVGINPSKLLMIGDSLKSDVIGPGNLGIKTIHKNRSLKLILDEYL